ncbi:MAG: hypothetical protein H6622_11090 [Halobacteriovoraceae bacterium]|nr:hypothetical protein [Halobacteriovoraceae bacterium]
MKLASFLFLIFLSVVSFAEITLEDRGLKIKNFPCMNCHSNINNSQANFPLQKPHDRLEFKHMDSVKNCFQCHDKSDRNQLVLLNGEKINFNESHKQCFQCHGTKKRDWELGIHGKSIGSWSGDKYKFTCASCHEPHHPKFRKMQAVPGPVHPRKGFVHGGNH